MEKSKFMKINCHDYSHEDVVKVSSVFKKGGLVIFPTETVYGIGADAGSDAACKRIFQVKSRKQDNPLIVHVDSIDTMKKFALTEEIELLPELEKLWPGPLTVVMRKKDNICNAASAGLDTVGMRIPACDFIREVIHSSGIPIAAPSANISGRPSATRIEHIISELGQKVDLIIDSGETIYGIESTVILPEGRKCTILRPGAYTEEDLLKIFDVVEYSVPGGKVLSPGAKYTHYSPEKRLYRAERSILIKYLEEHRGRVLPIITFETHEITGGDAIILGHENDPMEISHNLYHSLRLLDSSEYEYGIIESFPHRGYFTSIMNRIEKASIEI